MKTSEHPRRIKTHLALNTWSAFRIVSLAIALCGLPGLSTAALLGHWTFEEGTGTTTADLSGTGNTGTLTGTPLPVWVSPGAVGAGALDFTPTARVSLPNSASLQLTGPLTLTAWTWADASAGGRVITKGGNSGSRGWELSVETGGYYNFLIPVNATTLTSCRTANGTVPLGVWVHLAAVYDPSGPSMTLYTNGVLAETTISGTIPAAMYNPASISPSIGARADGTRWDGKLDEIRLYNEALTQAQIQALPELAQNALAFTVQPASTSVEENKSVTFSTAFTGSPALFVQWYENGLPIAGANGLTYRIPVVSLAMNNNQYSVSVSNFVYGIASTNAILSVSADLTAPTVVSANSLGNPNQVIVRFSEAVTSESAGNVANYSITNLAGTVRNVIGATLGADNLTVTLLTDTLSDGSNYVLVVNSIQDRAVTPQTIAANTAVPFTCHTMVGYWPFNEGSGTIAADLSAAGNNGTFAGSPLPVWVTPGAVGAAALDFTPTARVVLPNSPSLQITGPLTLTAWTLADAAAGGRVISKGTGTRGWELTIESGGRYQFLVPVSAGTLITCGTENGAAALGVWTHLAGVYNPSDPLLGDVPSMRLYTNGSLAAVVTANVPAVMYNNTGITPTIGTRPDGNNRWDGKLDEVRVYGEALTEAQIQALPELVQTPLAFTLQPSSVTVLPNTSVTFTNAFTGSPPYYIQWYSNDVAIPGAIGLTYTIPTVAGSMNGDKYRVTVSNLLYGIASTNATLNVNTDNTRPVLASVLALGYPNQVIVTFSEPVSAATAGNAANYTITNSTGGVVNALGATIGADNFTITLLTEPMADGSNYVLVVNNIQDLALIPNTILPGTTAPFTYSSLVGHWRFEEGSGSTTADSGLGGFTGTLLNEPTWVIGQIGQYALDFDGSNDRVDVGNPAALQLTGPMTLAAWVWADSFSDNGRIVTKQGASGNRGWALNAEGDGRWAFQIATSPTTLESVTAQDATLNEWVHLAGVYDPNNLSFGPVLMLYTNGVLAGIAAASQYEQSNSGLNVTIGARPDGTTRWNGKIDEVRIYARALSDAEIAALAAPPLKFLPPVLLSNELILNWTGTGQLQSAPAVTGVYTNVVPAPTPPYTNVIVPGGSQFFRLVP